MSSSHLEWAVASGLAGWAAARLSAVDHLRRAEDLAAPVLSFTPQAAAGAWAAALLLRGRGPRATAALAGAVLTAFVAPRALPRRQPAAAGPVLRVLTANLLVGRVAAEPLVELVAETGADVLCVQELTDGAVARLQQAGLGELLPHQVLESVPKGSRGNGIYARYPLAAGQGVAPVESGRPACRLELLSGQSVQVVCVHTRAPVPDEPERSASRWRAELAMFPPPGGTPVILAGDFNATLDHAHFRSLLRRGYADAASQVGKGLAQTWAPRPGGTAVLAIDHVLADSRCAVLASSAHRLPGTDHRAVYAEIRLPLAID